MNSLKESPHETNRKTAILVGMLYIIGTVAGILSLVFAGPILQSQDYLLQISINPNQIVIGALFVLTMGLALAMVPVLMFPILESYNRALALGYVLFRGALEAVTYLLFVIGWLSLPMIARNLSTPAPRRLPFFNR